MTIARERRDQFDGVEGAGRQRIALKEPAVQHDLRRRSEIVAAPRLAYLPLPLTPEMLLGA
jgi:hypothetical protein